MLAHMIEVFSICTVMSDQTLDAMADLSVLCAPVKATTGYATKMLVTEQRG